MGDRRGLYALDARVKLCMAFAALGTALAARHPATPCLIAGFVTASLLWSAHGRVSSLLRPLHGIAMVAGVPVLLVAWQQDAAAAFRIGSRIVGASSIGWWLLQSTALGELQSALVWFRAPRLLVELLGLAHRYATVFLDRLFTARDAQMLRLGYAGVRRGLRSIGSLAGLVFAHAIDQTTILAEAMALRGHRDDLQFTPLPPPSWRDVCLVAAGGAALLAAALGPSIGAFL